MIFPNRFADKAIIVTGAAQGIGQQVATRAAAEGAQILLVDRADFVTEVARDIGAQALIADLETHAGAAAAAARPSTSSAGSTS
jgi:dihydroxycyclohexadiene carboxylate dehydrogenase